MGFDGRFSIYHYNKNTKNYEKLGLYDKDGKELLDIFPSRDGMLNQLLLGNNRHGFTFDSIGGSRGLPEWYVKMLKVEHPDWFDSTNGGWTYNTSEGTYYDYLELRGWAQGDVCSYEDWIAMEEFSEYNEAMSKPIMRNPLKSFMIAVDFCLDAYGIWYPKPGEVIIVCEMSY